jgi:histidyl-tRNA synthetase
MRAGQVLCANKLRQAGYAVDVLLEPAKKVAKAFNYADRVNGRRSIFVAPDEFANGKVRMKDLRSANPEAEKEVDLNIATLVEELQQRGIVPSTKPFGIVDSTEPGQLA